MNASEPGVWMVHCHILQHMATGMQTFWVVGNQSEFWGRCVLCGGTFLCTGLCFLFCLNFSVGEFLDELVGVLLTSWCVGPAAVCAGLSGVWRERGGNETLDPSVPAFQGRPEMDRKKSAESGIDSELVTGRREGSGGKM